MGKKLILIMIAVMLVLSCGVSVSANSQYVKIGLKYGSTALTGCVLKCDGGFYLRVNGEIVLWTYDNEIRLNIATYDTIDVTNISGEVLYTYQKQTSPLEAISCLEKNMLFNDLEYRGEYHFLIADGKMTVINTLLIEDYLKGVISAEMPSAWPLEALKAQAVAARCFTHTNMGKFASYGFNLDDTTTSQVYKGVRAEYPSTTQAVLETAGKLAMYGGNVANTYFYSSNGGKTENVKDVWGGVIPYLVVVEDIYEEVQHWNVKFTAQEVKAKLTAKGINIGDVVDMEIVARSGSDRVIDMLIIGTNGSHRLTRQESRSFFGIKSNLFTISKKGELSELPKVITRWGIINFTPGIATRDGVFVANITDVITKDGVKKINTGNVTEYEFSGKGYGHGAGMSQYGAKGMAERGFTYKDIIEFYYPGVYIQ